MMLIYNNINIYIFQAMVKQEDESNVMYEGESDDTMEEDCCGHTQDGSVDSRGKPALKKKSGGWVAGIIILGMSSHSMYYVPYLKETMDRIFTCMKAASN
jgi:hypothetical protein